MKSKLIVIIITIFLSGCVHSTPNNKVVMQKNNTSVQVIKVKSKQKVDENAFKKRCNIDIVREVDENMDSLSNNEIYLFLFSFDTSCANNVEYSEYSNEVLFRLLSRYPKQVAKNIIKDSINEKIILHELSSPVNDGINLKKVIESVENAKIDENVKKKFLNALKKGE